MKIGSYTINGSINFTVWAPFLESLALHITAPTDEVIQMKKEGEYFNASIPYTNQTIDYLYIINNYDEFPDPASHYQPHGVHKPSRFVDHSSFNWSEGKWKGIKLKDLIIYELHIGTFTPEGTFTAAEGKLDYLKKLGITAIEIMPVAQFPGERNWGYDGVYTHAVQHSYGGPEAFKSFINAAHNKGIAVILDVVYNHFGPEGNYTSKFAPYFTNIYKTPWGDSLNFDDQFSDGLRNYFLKNALTWFNDYHIDGLRLDAIDKIKDLSAKHFLQELAENLQEINKDGKQRFLIAESDLNDDKIIRPLDKFGYGINAQWADDFHHALHSLLTKETDGYYGDFGNLEHLKDAFNRSFVYNGSYSPYRKRKHGNDPSQRSLEQFVVCSQNHDQIGNRAFGDRLSSMVSFDAAKLAAGAVILSPFTPLLYMGEEYLEKNPFLYFTNHGDESLNESVKNGRKEEFSAFSWKGEIPDPTIADSFNKSQLDWNLQSSGEHKQMLNLYKELIRLRRKGFSLKTSHRKNINAYVHDSLLMVERNDNKRKMLLIMNFNEEIIKAPAVKGDLIITSQDEKYGGSGYKVEGNHPLIAPHSFYLYHTA
jgi:maltooligosyltrehalose trehalohydrolase